MDFKPNLVACLGAGDGGGGGGSGGGGGGDGGGGSSSTAGSTPGTTAASGGSSASSTPNNADLSVIVSPGLLPGVPGVPGTLPIGQAGQNDDQHHHHHHHQQFNIFPAFFSKQLNFNHHQGGANSTKLMDDLRPNLSLLGVAGLVDDHHLHHHHHHGNASHLSPGQDRIASDRIASLQEKIRKCGGGGGEDFASLYQQPLQQHMDNTPTHTPTHTPSPVVNRGIQDHTGERKSRSCPVHVSSH